jgi:uncharacterized BrkB/YihY/UPF0761 family membrane protein
MGVEPFSSGAVAYYAFVATFVTLVVGFGLATALAAAKIADALKQSRQSSDYDGSACGRLAPRPGARLTAEGGR